MKRSRLQQNCVLLASLFLAAAVNATTLSSATTAGTNFSAAAFRFWSPDGAGSLRGLVVLVPGSNCDGRWMVEDGFWQDFARRHEFGLVGCLFKDRPHDNMNIEEYARASAGSGQALLDAICEFAARANNPGIADAPLLLWGHSAGGEFNYEFACWKPERVLAFVVNKGGYYFTHLASAAARLVPGIFFVGERDEKFRVDSIRGLFSVNREAGALWTLAVEPDVAHEVGKTRELAASYFEAVIALRMAKTLAPANPVAVRAAPRYAWTGNVQSLDISPASADECRDAQTAWLPDGAFARRWQVFVRGRSASEDNTAQPATGAEFPSLKAR